MRRWIDRAGVAIQVVTPGLVIIGLVASYLVGILNYWQSMVLLFLLSLSMGQQYIARLLERALDGGGDE